MYEARCTKRNEPVTIIYFSRPTYDVRRSTVFKELSIVSPELLELLGIIELLY